MVLITANKIKQLLVFTFAGQVQADQIVKGAKDAAVLMTTLEPGFRVLADLTSLDSMTVDCAPEIAKVMDLCAGGGVKLIVRVIPDPAKDVGFSILSRFHYPHKPHAIACKTLSEAGEHLGI